MVCFVKWDTWQHGPCSQVCQEGLKNFSFWMKRKSSLQWNRSSHAIYSKIIIKKSENFKLLSAAGWTVWWSTGGSRARDDQPRGRAASEVQVCWLLLHWASKYKDIITKWMNGRDNLFFAVTYGSLIAGREAPPDSHVTKHVQQYFSVRTFEVAGTHAGRPTRNTCTHHKQRHRH